MSFNPKDFIKISKELKIGLTEAHFRSTINRAYYGVFGYINNDLKYVTQNAHQDVIRFLKASLNINEKKAGSRLETLFKKRKDADYKYHDEIRRSSCDFCINEAEAIIELYDTREDKEE